MLRNEWPVDKGIRPAGSQEACFYCHAAKGDQHRDGCTMRVRTVVVRVFFEYIRTVPEHNESSSCAGNILADLESQADARGCACGMQEGTFLREATAEDEENFKKFVKDAES